MSHRHHLALLRPAEEGRKGRAKIEINDPSFPWSREGKSLRSGRLLGWPSLGEEGGGRDTSKEEEVSFSLSGRFCGRRNCHLW